jgi:SAM-dependent methyltransferase
MKIYRTADKLYLKENRYKKTKDIFKFAYSLVKNNKLLKNNKKTIVSDYGCAAGEFLFYLRNKLNPNYELFGFDYKNDLLKKARFKLKNFNFKQLNILNKRKKYKNFSKLSFCIGVLQIFDNFHEAMNNLIYYTDKKGIIVLHFLSNKYNFDANIKYSKSVISGKKFNYKQRIWESGWNIISKATINNFLKKHHRVNKFHFKDFKIKKNLKKQKDSMRSWTINVKNKKEIINGLGIIQNHSFVIINLL